MTTFTAVISRTGTDLTLTTERDNTYVLAEDGIVQPARVPVTTVETNMFIDGGLPTGLRLDVGEWVFRVLVQAATRSSLEAKIFDLVEAVSEQLVFTLTTTAEGAPTHVWNAYAGPVSVDNAGNNLVLEGCGLDPFEQLIVTIPVQPRSS